LRVRRGADGALRFVVYRFDGSEREVAPADLPNDYLAAHGWDRRRPLAVVLSRDPRSRALELRAWEEVGRATGVNVFGVRATGAAGWDVVFAPEGQDVPLVTGPLGRLWPPGDVSWLPIGNTGLASPTAALV